MKMGAFAYLLKPIKLEELLVKIGHALEKKSSQNHKIRKSIHEELMGYSGNDPKPA